ncbi:hypothetical protein [Luteolibacter sp. Populi]|uniref:hypothetical protein n=1 Tax=Luteolibacter sp. Populi TaxID=3230487 RepID=UPI00346554E5
MKGALGHGLESKRLERWMALLSSMEPGDGPAIAALLDEEKAAGRQFGVETMAFWQTWARVDAKGAWAYAQEHADAVGKSGVESLLKSWAFGDPAGAKAAFAELGESPLKEMVLSGLAHGLAESDPAAAVDFASGLPEGLQIDAAVHVCGSIISTMGNEGAQAWFDKLPADSPIFNKEASRVMMEALSRSEPGAVEKFAFARLDQQWATRPAEQNFAASMIMRNGGSPWDFVAAVMEKHPRPDAPLALTVWVANLSPKLAITWADANPDHPAAERVLAGASKAFLQRGNPEQAAILLERVTDPDLRERAGRE